jgi:beta-ureidopropionase / N-carbamoyl-L-amino-acid hydrolase
VTAEAIRVNGDRLTEDLRELSAFGRRPDGGISRTSYSSADLLAREWFAARCAAAGLRVRTDGLGNIFARLDPVGADPSLPAVWTGSHLDSVPEGGAYDGAAGVMSALECLRRLAEERAVLQRPVQLVVFADEEGCYHHLLGSTAMTSGLTHQQLSVRRGRDGTPLVDALAAAGFDPDAAADVKISPADVHAYVELHIEQGPVLASAGIDIGVVTSIVGIGGGTVRFTGRADHAGTTPMPARRDALLAAGHFLVRLPEAAARVSGEAVITCGLIDVSPAATNVVPATADVQLDFRDQSMPNMRALADEIARTAEDAARQCSVRADVRFDDMVEPVLLDAGVERVIEQSAASLDYRTLRMPSGAGHDAQNMARIARAGMIFVPSVDGRSHTKEEYTSPADLERGANVLLETLTRLCSAD